MDSRDANQAFESFLRGRGVNLSSLAPGEAVDTMIEFYRGVRADDCDASQGDMLLFQWGTYDWGSGPAFELDITRQFCRSDEDEDIWQLHLTYRFEPTDDLRALGSGNRWCQSPEELENFVHFVRSSAPYERLASRSDIKPHLDYECAG